MSSVTLPETLHGQVSVTYNAATADGDAFTTVVARFFDGPTPEPLVVELDSEVGECQLMVPNLPFCSEPCVPDVCTSAEVCTPYPAPVGVGTLGVAGLGAELTMQPASSMQVYQAPSLPNPPCEEGSSVSASLGDLTLEAECIAQLELTATNAIPVAAGAPVRVDWVAAVEAKRSRILIRLDVAHHGGKKGEINCNVPDAGSFDIPEELVTKLVGLGLAGYPDISVTRVSSGAAAGRPDVSILLSSNVLHPVDTGVKSCQEASQCPGQDCLDTHVCG